MVSGAGKKRRGVPFDEVVAGDVEGFGALCGGAGRRGVKFAVRGGGMAGAGASWRTVRCSCGRYPPNGGLVQRADRMAESWRGGGTA